MEQKQLLLEVKNLNVSFERKNEIFTAVNNIQFDIKRSEVLGMVGESGSGKSLSAYAIMQLTRYLPSCKIEGDIIWHAESPKKNLVSTTDDELQKVRGNRIGMIFQEPLSSLNPVFTCGFQVLEVLQVHKSMKKEAAAKEVKYLFERVKLKDPERIFKSFPTELSGGQRQRVMIAMAIACRPDLLIADEPTTALDASVQQSVIDLLMELREELNMAILFISHDLNLVRSLADRMLVMRNGVILEEGPAKDVFRNPQNAYTQGLLACRPPMNKRLERLPTIADFENSSAEISFMQIMNRFKRKEIQAADPSETPILEVKNLSVDYAIRKRFFFGKKDYLRAVDKVSFRIPEGKTVGLVGESGSGKSSIGKAIVNLLNRFSGSIHFHTKTEVVDLLKTKASAVGGIQMIFQDPLNSLNPRITIGEAIMEPLLFHKLVNNKEEAEHKAIMLLEKVGLNAENMARYPNEFSGGQRQRIGIARALTLEPKLIICDECVSALDVSVQAQILNLLSDLQEENQISYLFISHDLSVIKHMSDWILVLQKGEIIEQGSNEDIFDNPQHPYTQNLIQSMPGD